MRHYIVALGMVLAAAGFTACEYNSSGSSDSFNSNIGVNVSGSYKDPNGSYLVRARGANNPTTATEKLGTGNGVQATFAKVLANKPVTPGTVAITDGIETFTDPAGAGLLTGDQGGTGSIEYSSGAVSVNFFLPPVGGQSIMTTYQYYGPGTSENPQAGNAGSPLFAFSVRQEGNAVEIVDDRGQRYAGRISDPYTEFDTGDPTTTSAQKEGRVGTVNTQRQIGLSYPFEVEGLFEGNPVRIAGQFKTEITIVFAIRGLPEGGFQFEELFRRASIRMIGTWIETASGNTADINAAGPSDVGAIVLDPLINSGPLLP